MTTQPNPVQLQIDHANAADQYGTACTEHALNPNAETAEARRNAYAAVLEAANHLAGIATNQSPTDSDIDAIRARWSRLCGSCDGGLPQACTCPDQDSRGVIVQLCDELERTRAELVRARIA